MPWAIKRSLSPGSPSGKEVLRSTLLTDDNKLQLERLQKLILDAANDAAKDSAKDDAEAAAASGGTGTGTGTGTGAELAAATATSVAVVDVGEEDAGDAPTAARGMEAVASLLGSKDGAALRRIAADVDSTDMFLRLASAEASEIRKLSATMLADAWEQKISSRGRQQAKRKRDAQRAADEGRWESEEYKNLTERQNQWKSRFVKVLIRTHVNKQFSAGWRGVAGAVAFSTVVVRVCSEALARALLAAINKSRVLALPKRLLRRLRRERGDSGMGSGTPGAEATPAPAR